MCEFYKNVSVFLSEWIALLAHICAVIMMDQWIGDMPELEYHFQWTHVVSTKTCEYCQLFQPAKVFYKNLWENVNFLVV